MKYKTTFYGHKISLDNYKLILNLSTYIKNYDPYLLWKQNEKWYKLSHVNSTKTKHDLAKKLYFNDIFSHN